MSDKKTALIEKIGRRVDRTITNNRSSFDTWVAYQFEDAAKIVDRRMKVGADNHSQHPGTIQSKGDVKK